MMGRTHALTGVAAGIGATYLVQLSTAEALCGIALVTGGALLPDIDHPRSTVTGSFGPVTALVSKLVRHLSGGHRAGTHSIAGVLALGLVTQYGVMKRDTIPGQVVLCVVMILTLAGAVRVLRIPGWVDDVAPIPIVVTIVCWTDVPLTIVPPAVMLGCAIHIAGDMVTRTGCPLWWPVSRERSKLDLFTTGGRVESVIVTPFVGALIAGGVLGKVVDTFS